jgi:hypothetical protein
MAKTFVYIFIFFFASTIAVGQIHPTVKHIFYDLPLDKNRADLRETIATDKRFTSTDTVSNILKNSMPYFLGVTADKGVIKSKPDSTEIQLTFGSSTFASAKGGQKDFKSIDILNFKYFYSNKDSVELEYKNLIKMLSAVLKDSSDTKMETTYSKDPTRSQFKAVGKVFESFDPYYSVEILSASVTNNIFGLYIEFRREEK